MRYRDTGPHERVQYWQGHMRNQWSKGPRPAHSKDRRDPTALTGTREKPSQRHVSKRTPDHVRVTRRMTRQAVTRLLGRINHTSPQWARNLAQGSLNDWLNTTRAALDTHTTITLTNGQWREISKT